MTRVVLAELARAEREAYIRVRLQEAVQALRRSPMPANAMPHDLRVIWPDFEREKGDIWWAEGGGLLPGTRTRMLPTRAQISAMDEVIPWLYRVSDTRWRLAVFLRAWPMGWRRVGDKLEVSHMTAKAWERQGIEQICQGLTAALRSR
jgi:hypothetical protein